MKIYVITDTHFNHKRLIEWGRPEDFEHRLLSGLSRTHGDLLIHLGDFCVGEDVKSHQDFMVAANGFVKKILIRGNHDSKSDGWYLSHGWDMVCEIFGNEYFGKRLFFTHVPQKRRNLPECDFNIHGHMHGNSHRSDEVSEYDANFNIDMAPELRGYIPVNLEDFLKKNPSITRG